MRIDEYKDLEKQKIDEFLGAALRGIGKGLGIDTSGIQSSNDDRVSKLAQSKFINNFISSASSSLASAIQGGLVNPKLKTPKTKGSAGAAAPAPASPQAAAPPAAQQAPAKTRTGGKVAGQLSTNPKAVARRQATAARRATQAGLSVSNPAKQAAATQPAPAPAPTRTTRKKKAAPVTSQTISIGGQKLKPGTPAHTAIAAKMQTKESSYEKLNKILEDVINLKTDKILFEAKVLSIGQYLKNWFPSHMQGLNYSAHKKSVDDAIAKIEQTYNQDGGKAELQKLAQMSYALMMANASNDAKNQKAPATATQAPGQQQPAATQAPQQPNGQTLLKQLRTLQKTDPAAYAKLIKKLKVTP